MQNRNRLWIGAAAVLGVVVLGLFVVRLVGANVFQRGMQAYHAQDYQAALEFFEKAGDYPAFLGGFVQEAGARLEEVQMYAQAQELWLSGEYARALDSFEVFMQAYPDSAFMEISQTASQEIHFDWADACIGEGDFETALSLYNDVIQDVSMPGATVGRAQRELPAAYVRWGQALSQAGSYETAIQRYLQAAEVGETSEAATLAKQELQSAYKYWAEMALKAADFAGAETRYRALLDWQAANAQSNMNATIALLAEAYFAWGNDLFGKSDYPGAIAKQELAIELDAPIGANAHEAAAQAYLQWGDLLAGQGDLHGAGEKYWMMIENYGDSAAVGQMTLQAFEPLALHGEVLLQNQDYASAATLYEFAVSLAGEGQEVFKARAYLGWGRALIGSGYYFNALVKLKKASELNAEAAFKAIVDEVNNTAITGVGQLTDKLGKLLMYATLDILVDVFEENAAGNYCDTVDGVRVCLTLEQLELAKPAMGMDSNEARMLLFTAGQGRTDLPEDIQAVRPGHFR